MFDFNFLNMFFRNSYWGSGLGTPFFFDFCWQPFKLDLPFSKSYQNGISFENNNLPPLFDFNKPQLGISTSSEQPFGASSLLLTNTSDDISFENNNTSFNNSFISNNVSSTGVTSVTLNSSVSGSTSVSGNTSGSASGIASESAASSSIDRTTKLKGIDITKFPETEIKEAEKLYKKLNLQAKGLDYGVFICAYIGYNKIKGQGSGYLGIFDTTQNSKANRYYLINMKNQCLVGQCGMKAGTGDMSNVTTANKLGSNATLSGFEKIGEEYQSTARWRRGRRIYGLEKGINDTSIARCTVAHYTELDTTLGCKGIPAIMKENGDFDHEASLAKLRKFFPTGTILFTAPTGTDYWDKSKLL